MLLELGGIGVANEYGLMGPLNTNRLPAATADAPDSIAFAKSFIFP